MLDTTTEAEKLQRIERWRVQTQKEHEALVKKLSPEYKINPPNLSIPPSRLAYNYIVIAQKASQP